MTLIFAIVAGWIVFWAIPFAGGAVRQRVGAVSAAALRALDLTIIAAWILMLALVALLSPTGMLGP